MVSPPIVFVTDTGMRLALQESCLKVRMNTGERLFASVSRFGVNPCMPGVKFSIAGVGPILPNTPIPVPVPRVLVKGHNSVGFMFDLEEALTMSPIYYVAMVFREGLVKLPMHRPFRTGEDVFSKLAFYGFDHSKMAAWVLMYNDRAVEATTPISNGARLLVVVPSAGMSKYFKENLAASVARQQAAAEGAPCDSVAGLFPAYPCSVTFSSATTGYISVARRAEGNTPARIVAATRLLPTDQVEFKIINNVLEYVLDPLDDSTQLQTEGQLSVFLSGRDASRVMRRMYANQYGAVPFFLNGLDNQAFGAILQLVAFTPREMYYRLKLGPEPDTFLVKASKLGRDGKAAGLDTRNRVVFKFSAREQYSKVLIDNGEKGEVYDNWAATHDSFMDKDSPATAQILWGEKLSPEDETILNTNVGEDVYLVGPTDRVQKIIRMLNSTPQSTGPQGTTRALLGAASRRRKTPKSARRRTKSKRTATTRRTQRGRPLKSKPKKSARNKKL